MVTLSSRHAPRVSPGYSACFRGGGSSMPSPLTRILIGSLLIITILGQTGVHATEPQVEQDSLWSHELVGGLNLTQVALKDWTGGGDDAIAWSATLTGSSEYDRDRIRWSTQYGLAFGQTKLGDGAVRKTDDRIDLASTMTYVMGVYVNPYVGVTLNSQFATGYKYTDTDKVAVSRFFDPAYLTQTVGLGYQPMRQLKTRAGLGLRQIVTRRYRSYAGGDEDGNRVKVDAGLESVTEARWRLADNVLLTSRLQIFVPVTDVDRSSVRNDTNINLEVSRYVSTNLSLQIVDDSSAHPDTQIKQVLAVGLSYRFM